MELTLKEVTTKREMKEWIEFPYRLYKSTPSYIPQLRIEQKKFFTKNPVFKVAEVVYFYVKSESEVVGRVAALVHSLEVKKLGIKRGRFGFFESIDDKRVGEMLLAAATEWLVSHRCVEVHGPHCFSDLDPEGLLIEGFDELPPVSSTYAMPYFREMIESFGFVKEDDYIEHRIVFPKSFPVYERMKEKLWSNREYRMVKLKKIKDFHPYLDQFWPLMEECYAHLHGVTPLTKEQIEDYTKNNIGMLDPDFVKIVVDRTNKVVGFFIGMPNLSRAFQRAKGRIFPGIIHIIRAFKNPDTIDFILIGVKPSLPKKSIILMLMGEMFESCNKRGIQYAESNRQLESNHTIADIWKRFDNRLHRRSRMYRMDL